jgi:hypothetical protein
MTKRILLTAMMFMAMLFPTQSFAQAAGGGGESTLGLPILSCRVETSVDSLYYDDNLDDYSPNRITLTVWVRNIGETGASPADTAVARGITVSVRQDTRFNIDGLSFKPLVNPVIGGDSLRFGDSASVTFEMVIASPRSTDGFDEVAAIVVSDNANHTTCTKDLWVEHEYFPVFNPLCTKGFTEIVWDDNIDNYNPNPFTINLVIENIGDGASDSTVVSYIGTPDVSLYEADEEEKDLGTILPGQNKVTEFLLRPERRSNDTTLSLCFKILGYGGYKSKIYIDTCCVEVFIPASKQAEYTLDCDINTDFVAFVDHAYDPDPFTFSVDIQNTGTAIGKDVQATIGLPPGIQLAAGETDQTKPVGDLAPNGRATVTWQLSPTPFFERDTLDICVTVFDVFDNRATCCDSVIIDSVRKAIFDVACVCPDTIFADTQQGVYINSPFDVFFHVRNVGSDYADSVKATLLIQAPNISPLEGYDVVSPKEIVDTLNFADTLSVDGGFTFTWPLEAFPIATGTTVRLVFKIQATNAEPQECVCEVFVQRLDAPNIDVICETIPSDSLHFDPRTGGYFPSFVIYRVCATNIGGGIARNVQANLAIAPSMVRAEGEPEFKFYNPRDLGPGDTACVEWMLIPVKRTTEGLMASITTETIAENLEERALCTSSVFIPALPNTAALAIPRNNVGYTNQNILVPIYVDDPEGKDIKKFEVELLYNYNEDRTRMASDVVEFIELITQNSLTGTWNVISQGRNASNDQLNFVLQSADDQPLSYPPGIGEDVPPLVWLKFRAVFGSRPNELDWTTTPVLWPEATQVQDRVLINDGSVFPRVTDGLITVSGDCLRPLTASPDYVIFNKPNPFNPATTITYTIPVDEHVKVTVFDALGREVEILVDEFATAGTHAVVFDSKGLPSGIYFYRMETPHYSTMKKMVVAK